MVQTSFLFFVCWVCFQVIVLSIFELVWRPGLPSRSFRMESIAQIVFFMEIVFNEFRERFIACVLVGSLFKRFVPDLLALKIRLETRCF